ncbi:glycoside hydrolase family 16 protein [Tilletiaria anomala UBC 951]|uniref:Glycoside hydrolase family 16 protein n=1 Tax=Tilletiaria anomala (strain ATCC 24038 / CBS 436.72 / UBC 951) TaxID=1037660 RepID=A0A066W8L8_TILAU|nr:glycoside hydrolase family 16 protein [Tilletiaria anomala UBC 951]KDN48848.1 glycoside hydrolase family 16 protein [Tilletiaria anomala UBC 951]
MFSITVALGVGALLAPRVLADVWNLSTTYQGSEFMANFDYWGDTNATAKDPSNGLVKYVGKSAAQSSNVTYVDSKGLFHLQVAKNNHGAVLMPAPFFFSDVTHVPTGCSVWPAFWLVNPDTASYPKGGEFDILENANDQFHGNLQQSGITSYANCTVDYSTGNNGCRVEMNQATITGSSAVVPTWGTELNQAGGGVFATERSMGSAGHGVCVWYWPQSSVPTDLKVGSQSVDPSTWGTPAVDMPIANICHSNFGQQSLVLDITPCGDWAGSTYNQSGCNLQYTACSYQVGYNGSSYNQSYWGINDVRVFGTGGNANAAISPNTATESASAAAHLHVGVGALGAVLCAGFVVSWLI